MSIPDDEKIQFDKLKWGSFTKQFKDFQRKNPKSKVKDLSQFADHVLKNEGSFIKRTADRARFYKNVIEPKVKGGVYPTDRKAINAIKRKKLQPANEVVGVVKVEGSGEIKNIADMEGNGKRTGDKQIKIPESNLVLPKPILKEGKSKKGGFRKAVNFEDFAVATAMAKKYLDGKTYSPGLKKDVNAYLKGQGYKGAGLKASDLKNMLKSTYHKEKKDQGDFKVDKKLSDRRVKVYENKKTGQVVVAHRGSQDWRDWLDNYNLFRWGKFKNTSTYQEHKKKHNKAVKKYGAENITAIGHSRAGAYVEQLNREQPVKEVITYNKAANWSNIGQKNPKNQYDIRTDKDGVSVASKLQRHSNDVITIPTDKNPVAAHGNDELEKLGDQYIGSGYAGGKLNVKKLKVGNMRKFIKEYHKRKGSKAPKALGKVRKAELGRMVKNITKSENMLLGKLLGGRTLASAPPPPPPPPPSNLGNPVDAPDNPGDEPDSEEENEEFQRRYANVIDFFVDTVSRIPLRRLRGRERVFDQLVDILSDVPDDDLEMIVDYANADIQQTRRPRTRARQLSDNLAFIDQHLFQTEREDPDDDPDVNQENEPDRANQPEGGYIPGQAEDVGQEDEGYTDEEWPTDSETETEDTDSDFDYDEAIAEMVQQMDEDRELIRNRREFNQELQRIFDRMNLRGEGRKKKRKWKKSVEQTMLSTKQSQDRVEELLRQGCKVILIPELKSGSTIVLRECPKSGGCCECMKGGIREDRRPPSIQAPEYRESLPVEQRVRAIINLLRLGFERKRLTAFNNLYFYGDNLEDLHRRVRDAVASSAEDLTPAFERYLAGAGRMIGGNDGDRTPSPPPRPSKRRASPPPVQRRQRQRRDVPQLSLPPIPETPDQPITRFIPALPQSRRRRLTVAQAQQLQMPELSNEDYLDRLTEEQRDSLLDGLADLVDEED